MSEICVIGAGAWGTGLAIVLGRKGTHHVRLWAHESDVCESITHQRVNEKFLPGRAIPDSVTASNNLAAVLEPLFAARAAPIERVLSSRYCRCLDTARIAFEGEPETFAPLDLLKTDATEKAAQLAAIVKEIRGYSGSDNLVMVTHLENIVALTGVAPREGEAVVVAPDGDGLRVLGRVTF